MHGLRKIRDWTGGFEEFLAFVTPTLLGIAVIGPGIDIFTGGAISAFITWYTFIPPLLLACAVVSQTFMSIIFGELAVSEKRYGDAIIWFLLTLPSLGFIFIACDLFFVRTDGQVSFSAALATMHLTQRALDGINMTLGGWVSVVALRLNPAIKQQREARRSSSHRIDDESSDGDIVWG